MSRKVINKPRNKTMKKLNCGPLGQNNGIRDSCLTKEVLTKLKEGFNDKYPENTIRSKQSNHIWKDLNNKLQHCDKETCWLDVLDDTQLKNKVKTLLYAPQKPIEWKIKPDTWLSNHDILGVMKQYEKAYEKFRFIGPTPIDFEKKPSFGYGNFCGTNKRMNENNCVCDELCDFNINYYKQTGVNQIGICFNLDKHTEGGSHWVSLFIDLKEKYLFYFDSIGDKMPNEIENLIEKIQKQDTYKVHINKLEHQKENSECGMYTLMFLITMLSDTWVNSGKKDNVTFKNTREKISFFKNKRISDNKVSKFRDIYFND